MEKSIPKTEVWQRGPVEGVPFLLQPVAHALLQANEEMHALMKEFSMKLLWEKPAGMASPAFHLQHMSGVIDRLFTYARGSMLESKQLEALALEGKQNADITVSDLLNRFDEQLAIAIEQLKTTDEKSLTDFRGVGRAQLPSTVIGLLMHAAEHTMRHLGQLIVTVKVLKGKE
jgi:uncharacterized damage-inducible protein DinB